MRIELDNSLDELPPVVALLEEYCGAASLDTEMLQAAELALDELLTNIISYAYPDSSQHRIFVDLSVELCTGHNALKIVITDDGIAFNPFQQADPAQGMSIEEQKLGGVGIHLVKKFMDEYSYQRIDGRNVVTLLKYLPRD
jgi:anti-sigma regulatory factor (Ser/Thr protein kinase)